MNSFFFNGSCSDPAYRSIRDGTEPFLVEGRAFTEALWQQYIPFADPHFRVDAQAHFIERFWEMYLAVALLDRGIELSPGAGKGPEFSFRYSGDRIWVEAVAPGPGDGPDRVPEIEYGVASAVPVVNILLRYANAVVEKRRQYIAAVTSGIVKPTDGYILAINSRRIRIGPLDNTLPLYIQALLPIGDFAVTMNTSTFEVVDQFYQPRESVRKANDSHVSTRPFLDSEYSFISAVLHSSSDCVNRPESMGRDFSILHNPMAARPLGHSLFSWCNQYSWIDGTLEQRPPER